MEWIEYRKILYERKIQWEQPYELIARKWMESFEKGLDSFSFFLIQQEFPTQKSLQMFLEKNKGNTQEAFKERIKHLKLESKRVY
jgi:hypothetical protein